MAALVRGERGLAPVMLVVIIAWALAAVLMLTGTLLAARAIDDRVGTIVHSTSAIDHNLDAVQLAARTNQVAARIFTAAKPLSGELGQVAAAGRGINRTSSSILTKAQSINGRVVSIDSRVHSIDGRVHSIDGRVHSIDNRVHSINGHVRSIHAHSHSIQGHVGSIDALVAGIVGSATTILSTSHSIDAGVTGININADRVIRRVRPIEDDLTNVLAQVGPGHNSPDGRASIHGHANSIDCSPVIRTARRVTMPDFDYCGK